MKPQSAAVLVVAALFLLPFSAFAQSESGGSPPEKANGSSTAETPVNPFLPGEQLIGFSAGLHFPVFLAPITDSGVSNLDLGGSLSFSYQYFIARGLSIGGNIAGAFNSTIGGLTIFTGPLGFTTSYWWTKVPLEFTALIEAGGYLMRYSVTPSKGMIDPFLKAGGGAYWRAVPSWSFGFQMYLWFVPEIHYGEFSDLSQYAGFVETSLAVVYHL